MTNSERAAPMAAGAAERAVAEALLESWLPAQRERLGIVGLSAGLVLPGGELLTTAHGHADRERAIPMTVDTPMRLASITKMFSVTALLMARDEGLLSLDAPLSELVPELSSVTSPAAAPAPITLRQCVSHTAGIPTNLPLGVQYWTPETSQRDVAFPPSSEARQWLRDLRLLSPPMTTFHYSNVGFMIVGLALEAAFGQPYEAIVTERILEPLGMDGAFFGSASQLERLAQGYRPEGPGGADALAPSLDVGWDTAGGGLCCSAAELARFVQLHLTDLPAGGAQVLGGSSVREARQPVFAMGDKGVGLGWWLRRLADQPVVMHSGNMAGFDACMMLVPELGMGLWLLSNTNRIHSSPVLEDLLASLVPVVSTAATIETRYQRDLPPSGVERVTGHYTSYEYDYDVVAVGGQLALVILGELDHVSRLEPTGEEGHYVGADGFAVGEPVVFREPRDGRFTELALQGLVLTRAQP